VCNNSTRHVRERGEWSFAFCFLLFAFPFPELNCWLGLARWMEITAGVGKASCENLEESLLSYAKFDVWCWFRVCLSVSSGYAACGFRGSCGVRRRC
jgi:hypothetical protein